MKIVIVADAEGAFPEYAAEKPLHGMVEKIGALHGGMKSGQASVSIWVRLEDGRLVFAEMSLRHFRYANALFDTEYTVAEGGG